MPPKMVVVETLSAQASYEITSSTKGSELLNMVCSRLGLRDEPLFGLQYTDTKGYLAFIKPDKKISAHKIKPDTTMQFRAQFFPENVTEELRNPIIQNLFWLQIRDGICSGEIYCPPDLCVFFAGQNLQALYGDFNPGTHTPGFFDVNVFLPQRVLAQFNLPTSAWEEKVRGAWGTQRGISREVVVMDMLTIAQDLEQYGITYFEVSNKRGARLWLGLHSLGMDIFKYSNKVTPQIGFPWSEIKNIAFNDKKFCITMTTAGTDFKFYAPRYHINKRILALSIGNHKLYIARRRAAAMGGVGLTEDRAAVEAKIRTTKEILKAIHSDLEAVRDAAKLTQEDKHHAEMEQMGMDRFKTLKKAQSGDAEKRVLEFNNMDSDA